MSNSPSVSNIQKTLLKPYEIQKYLGNQQDTDDVSIFFNPLASAQDTSVDYSTLGETDLSEESINEKAANASSKTERGFFQMLRGLFSNQELRDKVDKNNDGKIDDSEMKEFLGDIKDLDGNGNTVSLNDFAGALVNMGINLNGEDEVEETPQVQETQAANNAGSVGGSSGVSGSRGSSGSSASNSVSSAPPVDTVESLTQQKTELEADIQQKEEEIAKINDGTSERVASAKEAMDNAKTEMDEAVKNDKEIDESLKESFDDINKRVDENDQQISQKDTEISQKESSVSQSENSISNLENSLSSLAQPTGKDEDKDKDAKINARKSELQSQISDKKSQLQTAKTELENLKKEKTDLEKEKQSLAQEKAKIETQVLANCSDTTKNAIESYNSKKQEFEEVKQKELSSVKTELDTKIKELNDVEVKIQEKQNKEAETDASFDNMLDEVLKSEGGYSNHPNDSGGETNKGITHSTYDSYRQSKGLPTQSVANITDEEVKDIYYNNYYKASGADELAKTDPKLAFAVFDASVNHGVGGAQKLLNQSGNDVNKFMENRRQYYNDIVARNSSQGVFLNGWMNRMDNVQAFLDTM